MHRRIVPLLALCLAAAVACVSPGRDGQVVTHDAEERVTFWDTPRRGANLFNRLESYERLAAARALGVDFVRIAPDKWSAARRDFLIGDADGYEGLPGDDLRELMRVLDAATRADVKVVLTMLSLPGARWRQHNDNRDDARLWTDARFQEQAARFWRDLAAALRHHPALVGYDILNEPHPGRAVAGVEDAGSPEYVAWSRAAQGTTADLDTFNERMLGAVRAVDGRTPVILEPGDHASVRAMAHMRPVRDPAVLYSFHFYDPWSYTTWRVNGGRYAYPTRMPTAGDGPAAAWPRDRIAQMLEPANAWAAHHGVPPGRLLLGELGCSRRVPGAAEYLADVIDAAQGRGWHWAFYAYREDTWSDMDYELGPDPHSHEVLSAVQSGARPREPFQANPLYQMLRSRIRP